MGARGLHRVVRARGARVWRRGVLWAVALSCAWWVGAVWPSAATAATTDGGPQAAAMADDLPEPDGTAIFGCQAGPGAGLGPGLAVVLLGGFAARRWRPQR